MESKAQIEDKNIEVKQTPYTWSNFISFTRVFIAVPIIYLHYSSGQQVTWVVTALVLYGFFSDYLDGFVARKLNEVSEWGKMLDPIADKLAAFLLFAYAVYIDLIPLWFFAVEVLRDVLILIGSTYIRIKRGKVAMAVMSGKWCVNALSGYWMAAFFFPEALGVQHFFMGISLVLMIFSLIDYFQRFREINRGVDFK